ncbi:MAG: ABC transporter ATP-binding protein [Desulfobulbaceae bacterium]|nr:ABC transporter ATP-binding protein [Desulfobulbaceae bacterium]
MIKVENLTRKYGDFFAVDDVSFKISPGEIVGLLGHNGAGKTTIMKMITGFLEPTSGHAMVDGFSLDENLQEIQGKIGYLPENCPVYPEMTVIDYLDYAASLHGLSDKEKPARIREAIEKTELQPKAMQLISTLSRGYRQRVGVAQAILHKPKILILDEPTNGLDPTQIQHMRELVKNLAAEATIIISTHILHEVQAICDRVLIIRNGKMAMDSKLADLQSGARLFLSTDASMAAARELIEPISEIESLEQLSSQGGKYKYGLTCAHPVDHDDLAARIAALIHENGHKLYNLFSETRDLETIFSEISTGEGRA